MFRSALHYQVYCATQRDPKYKNENLAKSCMFSSENHTLLALEHHLQTDGAYSAPFMLTFVSTMASRN